MTCLYLVDKVKRCLIGIPIWGYQNFYSLPPKNWISGPKTAKIGPLVHFWSFWAKYCHFLHILSNARPKPNVNMVPGRVFRYMGDKTFDFSSKKKGFFAQKRPNLAQNWQFGPNTGIFGPFNLMPDQKTMRTSCLGCFLLCWYQNFYLLP